MRHVRTHARLWSIACFAAAGAPAVAQMDIGTAFNYQAQLLDGGSPVDGLCDFEFSLWNDAVSVDPSAQVGGTLMQTVDVIDGLLLTTLDFGADVVNGGQALWLEISLCCPSPCGMFQTFSPRQELTPAPASLALPGLYTQQNGAGTPNIIGGYSGNMVTAGTGATISGGGRETPSLDPNTVTSDHGTVSGGAGNEAGNFAVVGGGLRNTAPGSGAAVGGGRDNIAGGLRSTVAGGWVNDAAGDHAAVGGGDSNQATGQRSTIGGGNTNIASGVGSTVAGGQNNRASGPYDTVGGGISNFVLADYGTIAGGGEAVPGSAGTGNRVFDLYGTVGGGGGNQAGSDDADPASAQYATVSGGTGNAASGLHSSVGGGLGNLASGANATVGGGRDNVASTSNVTVGGGRDNTASGLAATVPGGENNTAAGDYSLAAGQRASANHGGSFVWSDSTTADPDFFASTAANQFLINAAGGVGIGTNAPTEQLTVAGTVESTTGGFKLPDGTILDAAGDLGVGDGHSLDAADGTPTDALFVDNDGSVGIGTTAPVGDLHVGEDGGSSSVYIDSYRSAVDGSIIRARHARGTEAAPSGLLTGDKLAELTFGGHDGTAFDNVSAKIQSNATEDWIVGAHGADIRFYTTSSGGTTTPERMRIAHDGNVGIGTTIPETPLDVRGTATSQFSSGNNANFAFKKTGAISPTNIEFNLSHRTSGTEAWMYGTDGSTFINFQAWDAAAEEVRFPANGAALVVELSGGNVGIGTATPGEALDVVGNINTSAGISHADPINFLGDDVEQILQINGKELIGRRSVRGAVTIGADDAVVIGDGESPGAVANNVDMTIENMYVASDNNIFLYTNLQNTWASREVAVFTDLGRLGIGTTAPSSNLDVEHDGTTATSIDINNTTTGDPRIRFQVGGTSQFTLGVDNSDAGKFKIATSGSVSTDTRMTIDGSGDVGIGTASPEDTLDVRGSIVANDTNGDNVVIKEPGNPSASNVEFVLSHRANGTETWMYGNDGTTFRNFQEWDYAGNAVRLPANGSTMFVDLDVGGVGIATTELDPIGFDIYRLRVVAHPDDPDATEYAARFDGDVDIVGDISKSGGSFKIDHPLDPENKYLLHSFVESPDMMNVYNGNIKTDDAGYVTVQLPEWFEALNRDFRYQLTVIGQFAQAIVAEEINGNLFVIRTDKPNVKVSWQVTGIRQDPWAEHNRIQIEELKPEGERGTYLHPQAYGVEQEERVED